MDRLTEEELEEWRQIIQTFPVSEREKWKTLVKSGKLIALVAFLDGASSFFEHLGAFGFWLNKVLKAFLFIVLAIMMFKTLVTGEVALSEIWRLFIK